MNDPSKAKGRDQAFATVILALMSAESLLTGDENISGEKWNKTIDYVEDGLKAVKSLMEDE